MATPNEQKLFAPLRANGVTFKNRIVMAPMTRSRAIGNLPNQSMAEYYSQRASAGLIITEAIVSSPNGLGYPRIPGIFSEEQTEAWKKITEAVHAKEGLIYAQIAHPGRIGSSINMPPGAKPVGPTALGAPVDIWTDSQGMVQSDVPEPLDLAGIDTAIQEFAKAAKNAIAAGFDGVELHGGNGYLMEQFLNPFANTRTDPYGGSVENRCRFVIEITQAVADAIGADKVGMRLSPYNTLGSLPHYEEIDATYQYLAKEMSRIGIQYIHLVDAVTRLAQEGAELKAAIRTLFLAIRANFNGLLILNGGYTKDRAIAAIESREADLISFGIPFIANPDLPYRLKNDLALTEPDRSSFYAATEKGYTDYPFYR